MGGGTIFHWATLPGFPPGDEGRNANRYTGRQGVLEGALRYWALPHCPGPFSLKALFLTGLEDSWLHWGGAKPLALIPLPTSLLSASCCPAPHSPTGLQLWEVDKVLGKIPEVTEQTAPSPPQPLGWRETRFWFLRLHEHTEVHVLP